MNMIYCHYGEVKMDVIYSKTKQQLYWHHNKELQIINDNKLMHPLVNIELITLQNLLSILLYCNLIVVIY